MWAPGDLSSCKDSVPQKQEMNFSSGSVVFRSKRTFAFHHLSIPCYFQVILCLSVTECLRKPAPDASEIQKICKTRRGMNLFGSVFLSSLGLVKQGKGPHLLGQSGHVMLHKQGWVPLPGWRAALPQCCQQVLFPELWACWSSIHLSHISWLSKQTSQFPGRLSY